MFAAILLLVAAHAYASHIEEYPPTSASMSKVLFNALKTGVLEVPERLGASWLQNYKLQLTKESISIFEDLLFTESIDAPQHGPEETALYSNQCLAARSGEQAEGHVNAPPRSRTATGLQDALVKLVKGGTAQEIVCLSCLLAKYAVYKTWLHERLCPAGLRMLEAAFSENPETLRFINRLARVRRRSDILKAFADGWNSGAAQTVWRWVLCSANSPVIAKLVDEYVEDHDDPVDIPLDLFREMTLECKYRLAIRLADLRPYNKEIDWYSFYVLSRFSAHPSERIRALCLKENVKFLNYESDKASESSRQSTDMEKFSPYMVPTDVWFEILRHLDELSQIYIVPEVHKLWRSFSSKTLSESLATHVARAKELNCSTGLAGIFDNRCYPWNRLSSSRVASLKWMASQPNDGVVGGKAGRNINWMWGLICDDIDQGRITVSHESYLDLYMCCTKARIKPPEFRQLPGMSDKEYVALMSILVYQYRIIPTIPSELLKDHCWRFGKLLESHAGLAALLLQGNLRSCNMLVMHLFLTKSSVPPNISDVLAASPSFYRLLLNRRSNIGKCFDIVPEHSAIPPHEFAVSHSVVDLCLLLRPEGDPVMLQLIEEAVVKYYCRLQADEGMAFQGLKQLGTGVLLFLCCKRENYSVDELSVLERVFEAYQIYEKDENQDIFRSCFSAFLCSPQFIIKLIR